MILLVGLAFAAEPEPVAPAPPEPSVAPAEPAPAPEPGPAEVPTDAAPTDAAPTDTAPADAAPTDAAPTDAAPADAAVRVAPEAPPEPAVPERRLVDRIAASVNEDIVTLSEVYTLGAEFVAQRCPGAEPTCVHDAELEVLDSLVQRALVHQELVRLELDVTAADVDQAIDRTVQEYELPDRQALRAEVEKSGKRWDEYREGLEEYLRAQSFQSRVLAPRVHVSEDEIRDQYQRVARKVKTPIARISGLGIAVPPDTTPEQEALIVSQTQDLVKALDAGEIVWDDAVRDYDAGVAAMFRDTEFTPTSIIEPLAKVVFSGTVGDVLDPVRMTMQNGVDVLFVVRVDELGDKSEVLPFEEVRDQLEDQVFQEKLELAEDEWYQRARREAAVSIKL